MFSFAPRLQEPGPNDYSGEDCLYKIQPPNIDEDPYFSVFSVVGNGSFYQHAVEQVSLVEKLKSKALNLSNDVPLVMSNINIFGQRSDPYSHPFSLPREASESQVCGWLCLQHTQ